MRIDFFRHFAPFSVWIFLNIRKVFRYFSRPKERFGHYFRFVRTVFCAVVPSIDVTSNNIREMHEGHSRRNAPRAERYEVPALAQKAHGGSKNGDRVVKADRSVAVHIGGRKLFRSKLENAHCAAQRKNRIRYFDFSAGVYITW